MASPANFIRARPSPALGGPNVECGEYVTGMRLCLCPRSRNAIATPSALLGLLLGQASIYAASLINMSVNCTLNDAVGCPELRFDSTKTQQPESGVDVAIVLSL
jgi:hypothetical protein